MAVQSLFYLILCNAEINDVYVYVYVKQPKPQSPPCRAQPPQSGARRKSSAILA